MLKMPVGLYEKALPAELSNAVLASLTTCTDPEGKRFLLLRGTYTTAKHSPDTLPCGSGGTIPFI